VHIARPTGRGAVDPLNILVPIDYSPHSYATIDWVLRQNFKQPFQIKLLTVLPPFSAEYAHEKNPEKASLMLARIQEIKVNANARLDQFVEKIEQQLGKNVVHGELAEGTPQDMILQAAKNWPAHLIVMGSHGLTGLKRFLLGSVSKAVASHAQCSVEVVRTLKEEKPPEPPPVEVARRDEEPRTPHVVPH
jgi:nucleotide-binding universal stress UspA family protein